jgi:hypothetical protein
MENKMSLSAKDEKAIDVLFDKALALYAIHGNNLIECLRRGSPGEFLLLVRQANPSLLAAAIVRNLGQDAKRVVDEAHERYRPDDIANFIESGVVAWMSNKHRRPH